MNVTCKIIDENIFHRIKYCNCTFIQYCRPIVWSSLQDAKALKSPGHAAIPASYIETKLYIGKHNISKCQYVKNIHLDAPGDEIEEVSQPAPPEYRRAHSVNDGR